MENIRATNYFTAFSRKKKKKKSILQYFLQIVDMINNYWEVKN